MGAILHHSQILNQVLLCVDPVGPIPEGEFLYCFHVGETYFWVQTRRDILGVRQFQLNKRLLTYFRLVAHHG